MLRPLGTFPIAKKTLELLMKNGFYYLEDVKNSPDAAKKFVNVDELMKQCTPPATVTALDRLQAEVNCHSVTTYSKALDNLLDSGFQCGTITELCGASGTGKTQICFQICVTAQLPRARGGLEGPVLFIDSRNGFSSKRLQDFIAGCQKDYPDLRGKEEDFLAGVTVVSVNTLQELFGVIGSLRGHLRSHTPFRVIIIDSLSLPVVWSLEETSVKYKFYFKVFEELQKLAAEYNIAVIIVNEFITQVDSKGNIGAASAGGQAVAHRCQKILMMARINDRIFAAKIMKSPLLPQITKTFLVTQDGIRDYQK